MVSNLRCSVRRHVDLFRCTLRLGEKADVPHPDGEGLYWEGLISTESTGSNCA